MKNGKDICVCVVWVLAILGMAMFAQSAQASYSTPVTDYSEFFN